MAHPKVIERANQILENREEDALGKVKEITNDTVLRVLFELETAGQQRKSIIDCLRSKLNITGDIVPSGAVDSLAQGYLSSIVESEHKTVIFETSAIRKNEKEESVDISTDSVKLSQSD